MGVLYSQAVTTMGVNVKAMGCILVLIKEILSVPDFELSDFSSERSYHSKTSITFEECCFCDGTGVIGENRGYKQYLSGRFRPMRHDLSSDFVTSCPMCKGTGRIKI